MFDARFSISAEHTSLSGHFPGNPIVPGVVILDEIIKALVGASPAARVIRLVSVKFFAPLAPEQIADVRFSARPPGRVSFTCAAGGRKLLSGTLDCA